jgi:hypothetical protein
MRNTHNTPAIRQRPADAFRAHSRNEEGATAPSSHGLAFIRDPGLCLGGLVRLVSLGLLITAAGEQEQSGAQ